MLLASAVLAIASLVACTTAPPEQALRSTIKETTAAIEGREAAVLSRHLAADFVGPEGLDREGAVRLAKLMFHRHRQVGVVVGPMDLDLQGSHATVRTTAVVAGGEQPLLPEAARAYRVVAGWRLEDGQWALTSLDWTPEF
jgi:hypothetical protein